MKQRTLIDDPLGTARFSPCGKYRYELTRDIGQGGILNMILLNPSKAGATRSDPTITRQIERTRRLEFGKLIVTNIFAFVATDPHEMRAAEDPIGPENDQVIIDVARRSDMVLCGWGATHGPYLHRSEKVRAMLGRLDLRLWCLMETDEGEPWHPLYVSYATKPKPYCWDRSLGGLV